jgi:hypothetical protein
MEGRTGGGRRGPSTTGPANLWGRFNPWVSFNRVQSHGYFAAHFIATIKKDR